MSATDTAVPRAALAQSNVGMASRTLAALARVWGNLRLRDAVIISFPVLIPIVYLVVASTLDYYRYRQFDDFWARPASIDHFFQARFHAAKHVFAALRTEHQLNPEAPDAGIIRLTVPAAAWDSMQVKPVESWGHWFTAVLTRENTLSKVQIRKRGDNSVHWLTPKGSFTVKTEQRDLFKGYQTFGLSAKDVLTAYVANKMARELGLLAANTEISPVYVNNRFYGLFRFNEAIDENFLRHQLRLPGNLFRGDAAERGEYFKGTERNLFENMYIWQRAAKSQRPTASATAGLEALLTGTNAQTLDEHRRLMALVDRKQSVQLLAYLLMMGDPWHMDGVHNEFFYEDPWSMVQEPLPWDTRLLDITRPPAPRRVNPFFQESLRDPFFVDEVLREERRMLDDLHGVQIGERLARTEYERYRPYFDFESDRAGIIPDLGTPEEVSTVLRKNATVLHQWISDARVAFRSTPTDGRLVLDFETRGYAGSDLRSLTINGGGGPIVLYADRNGNGVVDRDDAVIAGAWSNEAGARRFTLTNPEALYSAWNAKGPGIQPSTAAYRFLLTGSVAGITAVTPELLNRVNGQPVTTEALAPNAPVPPSYSWHSWDFPVARPVTHRFSGNVQLHETLEIPVGDTLLIAPGTTLRLDPNVSILILGHLDARGDSAHPIIFEQADSGKPWGTVALQGQGANNSIERYTRFYGGGGAVLHEVEYTGSVSLHYVDGVEYDHLEIARNVRSDDAFHAYHSSFVMRNCSFLNTNSDAIDLDYASGEISHCRFIHAGNDAFDLMTSNPRIMDNYIEGSDDKGISIGEGSNPFVFNNYITRCERGIEVKDGSEPLILNNTLVGNKVGLRERLKNVRYWHGGWGKVVNTIVSGNKTEREIDHNSRLSVWASVIGKDTFPAGQGDLIRWLYRWQGVQVDTLHAGVVHSWSPVTPRPPLVTQEFEEDLQSYADGWIAYGAATHLEKRNRNLTAVLRPWDMNSQIEFPEGVLAKQIDWDLRQAKDSSLAVFEIAGRDMHAGTVTLLSEQGRVSMPFVARGDLSSYQFVALTLPPARYVGIRISAQPNPGLSKTQASTGLIDNDVARLNLHGYRLFSSLDSLPRARSRETADASSPMTAAH
ncbi:MAG: right-handed parallel beta-helix repeat-containing protein [Gemmatimonadota bacterium]